MSSFDRITLTLAKVFCYLQILGVLVLVATSWTRPQERPERLSVVFWIGYSVLSFVTARKIDGKHKKYRLIAALMCFLVITVGWGLWMLKNAPQNPDPFPDGLLVMDFILIIVGINLTKIYQKQRNQPRSS
jgi:hypothetical protein